MQHCWHSVQVGLLLWPELCNMERFSLVPIAAPPHVQAASICTNAAAAVQANKFSDPVTGEDVVMLVQTDVTARVVAMQQVQQVLNAEQGLLEGIFPRQVRCCKLLCVEGWRAAA
jgi:hypothetical protein